MRRSGKGPQNSTALEVVRTAIEDEVTWLVIAAANGREELAWQAIGRNPGLIPFLPLCWRRRARRVGVDPLKPWLRDREPLFPGYLFVGVADGADWRELFRTPGVENVLRPAGCDDARGLSQDVIEALLARCIAGGGAVRLQGNTGSARRHCPGDRVRISSGPFAGFNALIDGQTHERVTLLLEVASGINRVSAPVSAIEAAPLGG